MVRIRGWLSGAWDLVGADLPIFSLATFIVISLSLFSLFILALPLTTGLYIMFSEKQQGHRPTLAHLWEGIGSRFPAAITVWIIYLVAGLPFHTLALYLQYLDLSWWSVAILFLWQALFWTPMFFVLPLIADRDLSAREASKLSWAQVRPRLGGIFLCSLVYSIVTLFGLFACLLGIIITIPVARGAQMVAYRELYADYEVPVMIPIREPAASEDDQDES